MAGSVERLQSAIDGRYLIEREIGRGGMATVYLARDLRQDRLVAIKLLHADLGMALGPERFRREIQLVTHLSHPRIVPIYDSGEADGSLYYVMPYIEGESLRSRLDRERQLPVDDAVRITCEVAAALDFAHRRGVVHRDIKPENILLEDGQALVADFGIARAVSAIGEEKLTQTGVTLGTPSYMSPEQATADRYIDGRSDIYSLGCVLYEMLSGQPPFVGPTAQAIIARHTLEQVPSLTIVRSTIPDEVEDVVMRALAKVPADRFASAAEFADALRACHESGGVTLGRAERRSRPRRGPAGAARRQIGGRRATLVLLALAPLLGGGAWAAWHHYRNRDSALATAAAANGEGGARRIVVRYFDDLSRGKQLGYLADGLTEALIDQLSGVRELDVVSKSGSALYRHTDVPVDSIARAFNVGTVVDGSVENDGGGVRVTVRLRDASGADFRRASFRQPRGDPLAIQQTLATQLAEFLRERLGEEIRLREQREGTKSPEAWALLQRAEQMRKDAEVRTRASDTVGAFRQFGVADSLLTEAEARDPRWADPVVLRGQIALGEARLVSDLPRAARYNDVGLGHAERALRLSPKNADALELRGTLRYQRWLRHLAPDPREAAALLKGAEEDLRGAVNLEPSHASAWSVLAGVYADKPDLVEATLATRRAYEEDAYLSNADDILWRLFTTAYDNEQFVDAIHWCDEGQRRFPTSPRFVQCQLWLLTTSGKEPDVVAGWRLVERLRQLTPARSWPYQEREAQMLVAAALARSGQTDSARHVLVHARADAKIDPDGELLGTEAFIRTLLGDRDEALRLIQVYLTKHPEHRVGWAQSQSWWWRDLRQDPRFKELVGNGR